MPTYSKLVRVRRVKPVLTNRFQLYQIKVSCKGHCRWRTIDLALVAISVDTLIWKNKYFDISGHKRNWYFIYIVNEITDFTSV